MSTFTAESTPASTRANKNAAWIDLKDQSLLDIYQLLRSGTHQTLSGPSSDHFFSNFHMYARRPREALQRRGGPGGAGALRLGPLQIAGQALCWDGPRPSWRDRTSVSPRSSETVHWLLEVPTSVTDHWIARVITERVVWRYCSREIQRRIRVLLYGSSTALGQPNLTPKVNAVDWYAFTGVLFRFVVPPRYIF